MTNKVIRDGADEASANGVATAGTDSTGCAHTPGPWVVHIDRLAVFGALRGVTRQQVVDCNVSSPNLPTAEREANARLIASAPELLAALKELIENVHDESGFVAARYAIAKAECYDR